MADIFISYSKPDREKVVMLAAYLESEGWTVWWDKNLNPGEPYRDQIMRELVAARAVIVLWTSHSTKSDFVRAEAGRAKAEGKLIPVKESDVGYPDIPLPFGEMHTEDISKRELIRAAVVAQLAKPVVQPSALWVASRTLRYQVLTWVGIVGGAITLFANLQGVLDLADWAKWLAANWHEWTRIIWASVFGWIGLHFPEEFAPLLSLAAFCVAAAFGAKRYAIPRAPAREHSWLNISAFPIGIVIALGASIYLDDSPGNKVLAYVILLPVILPSYMFFRAADRAVEGSEHAWIIFLLSYMPIMYVLVRNPESGARFIKGASSLGLDGATSMALWTVMCASVILIIPVCMVGIAGVQAVIKRLMFLSFGMLFLVGLNYLSIYAPDLRQLLKPPGSETKKATAPHVEN